MKTRSSCGLPCEMLEPTVGAAVLWRRGRAAWPPAAGLDHRAISWLLFEHIRAFLPFPFLKSCLFCGLGMTFLSCLYWNSTSTLNVSSMTPALACPVSITWWVASEFHLALKLDVHQDQRPVDQTFSSTSENPQQHMKQADADWGNICVFSKVYDR